MNEDFKQRIYSLKIEDGLKNDEKFFIRSRERHSRGGTSSTFYLSVKENFNFSCCVMQVAHGVERGFTFYFSGKLPAQLETLMNKFTRDKSIKEICSTYSNFNSYMGDFDVLYKADYGTSYYVNYNCIEFFPNKNPKSSLCVLSKPLGVWMLKFQREVLSWMYSLTKSHLLIDLLSKGIFTIEIDYD